MNVRQLQGAVSRRLLVWSAISIVAGLILTLAGGPFWRGFGVQAVAWGAIDAAIAAFGAWALRRRIAAQPDPPPEVERDEERRLSRLLRINGGLDVLYVTGGAAIAATLGQGNATWQGHGWGIVVQGLFLLFFDLLHAQAVPVHVTFDLPPLFDDPRHQDRLWLGSQAAALVVHGYPGTPDEVRALSELFRDEGWTVRSLLLPGFGAQIATLPQRRCEEWLAAVLQALQDLQREHDPVVVAAFSMGAALSIAAAAESPPSAMVLVAPFWRLGSGALDALIALVRPFLPPILRPLRRMNLDQPQIRRGVSEALPDLDLDDPDVRRRARDLDVPVSMVDQVRRAGRWGWRSAERVGGPLLIVQGLDDEVTPVRHTRRLLRRFRSTPRYVEVQAGHDLLDPEGTAWEQVAAEIRSFVRALPDAPRKPQTRR